MDIQLMQRRELLKRVAWMLGGAVSAPAVLAVLQGCSAREAPEGGAWAPKFLTAAQAALVAEIAEIMIPKTDTGGARDAGVPAFIDLMLADVYDKDDQQRYRTGLSEFEQAAATHGKPFLEQEAAQRVAIVKRSLEAAIEHQTQAEQARVRENPVAQENDGQARLVVKRTPKPFILVTRELTLLGFFTSRIGASEIMNWEPVPGAYHGCVPVASLPKHANFE